MTAYVSGRHRELVMEAIDEYGLPLPDYVIGDVGTTLYRVNSRHEWSQPSGWEDRIAADWNGLVAGDLAQLLDDLPFLTLQPSAQQNRCKLSYTLPTSAEVDELLRLAGERLDAAGVRANLVYSVDETKDMGLLDVLPRSASKLHALKALMRELGLGAEQVVFSGDSGNDLDVLASELPAVLVANAQDSVREEARRLAESRGNLEQLYLARGGFLGLNGNYAAGIVEGVAHYRPEVRAWLAEVPA